MPQAWINGSCPLFASRRSGSKGWRRSFAPLALLLGGLAVHASAARAESEHGGSASSFWSHEYSGGDPAPASTSRSSAPRFRAHARGFGRARFAADPSVDYRRFGHRLHIRPYEIARPIPAAPPTAPTGPGVIVFGDRLAHALAMGLQEGGAGPVKAIDASSEEAGLTAKDFPAWLQSIHDRLAQSGTIAVAVMLIGSNDRAASADGAPPAAGAPSTAEGPVDYAARIDAVAAMFRAAHIPLVWLGLPAVRDPTASADFVRLNGFFRDRAGHDGVTWIDCWEAFLDDAGRYSPIGPNVEGQRTRLRRADGFGFTHAGARKLASFLGPDIKRVQPTPQGPGSAPANAPIAIETPAGFDSALTIDVNAQIRREAGLETSPAKPTHPVETAVGKPVAGPVLTLTAPPHAPGGQLAGAEFGSSGGGDDHKADLVPKSTIGDQAAMVKPGRADDFSWPKP